MYGPVYTKDAAQLCMVQYTPRMQHCYVTVGPVYTKDAAL